MTLTCLVRQLRYVQFSLDKSAKLYQLLPTSFLSTVFFGLVCQLLPYMYSFMNWDTLSALSLWVGTKQFNIFTVSLILFWWCPHSLRVPRSIFLAGLRVNLRKVLISSELDVYAL